MTNKTEQLQELLQDLIDLCHQIDNNILYSTISSFQNQMLKFKKDNNFITAAEEIILILEEIADDKQDQDIIDSANDTFEQMKTALES